MPKANTETNRLKRPKRKFSPEEQAGHVKAYKTADKEGKKAYLKKHSITGSHISRWSKPSGTVGSVKKPAKKPAKKARIKNMARPKGFVQRRGRNKTDEEAALKAELLWICDGADRGAISHKKAVQQVQQALQDAA